jgi:hypothetical protein
MIKIAATLIIIALASVSYATEPKDENSGDEKYEDISFLIDFTDYSEGSVEAWLKSKGFKFEKDARDRTKLDLDVDDSSLHVEAKKPVQAFMVDEAANVKDYSKVRIEWGILKYPRGASYAKKINNEALMIYIFFGTDKVSSGSFLIPNSPYFIALYLCEDEKIGYPYKGRYFHKSGRFICLGKPSPNKTIVSEFDLVRAFKTYFSENEIPAISGISLAVDTTKSGDRGKAAAFLKSIEFIN